MFIKAFGFKHVFRSRYPSTVARVQANPHSLTTTTMAEQPRGAANLGDIAASMAKMALDLKDAADNYQKLEKRLDSQDRRMEDMERRLAGGPPQLTEGEPEEPSQKRARAITMTPHLPHQEGFLTALEPRAPEGEEANRPATIADTHRII